MDFDYWKSIALEENPSLREAEPAKVEAKADEYDMRMPISDDAVLTEPVVTDPVLYADEYTMDNFTWLYCEQGPKLLYVMKRMAKGKAYVYVMNFGDTAIEEYALPLDKPEPEAETTADGEESKPKKKTVKKKEESWKLLLSTDWKKYGGTQAEKSVTLRSKKREMELNVPAYSAAVYEVTV